MSSPMFLPGYGMNTDVFYATAPSSTQRHLQIWHKPRNKTMAQFVLVGCGGNGGNGAIGANSTAAGGGGGGTTTRGTGGSGGGGNGSQGDTSNGSAGTTNRGGGGGGGNYSFSAPYDNNGFNGGSGIVLVRFKV